MPQPSSKVLEQARRALLAGNRTEVVRLLNGFEDSFHAESRWLLAAAVEDQVTRNEHLWAVIDLKLSPYAEYAEDIIECERALESEMTKGPAWQRFFVKHRTTITWLIVLGVILVGAWIIIGLRNSEVMQRTTTHATAQAIDQAATETATHQPPTPTATATFLPSALITPANYPPFGSLRILSMEYPSVRTVVDSRNGAPQIPPVNSTFAAIMYEFTCGSGEAAFCEQPPEAVVSLLLANGQRVQETTLRVDDPAVPDPGVLPTGSVTRGWLVFPVPNSQMPTALILAANIDPTTPALEEIILAIPAR